MGGWQDRGARHMHATYINCVAFVAFGALESKRERLTWPQRQDGARGNLSQPASFRALPIIQTLPIKEQKREEFEDKSFPLQGK